MTPPRRRPDPGGDGLEAREAIEGLLAAKEVAVVCGPGGVGKTTTSASLAATTAAMIGGRVLVVTVDPARRLADALGVSRIGNRATHVPPEAFAASGLRPKGELHAAMIDMSESWDSLVRRHAPDAATARQILANPLYRNITRRFAEGHYYIAMERLFELHEEGDYDLVVVDTPPSTNALDLLDAPRRMSELFSSRLLRWLTVPYRSRLINAASRPFYQVADRVLGSQLLSDLADFFILLQTMRDGFVARAEAVDRLLHDPMCTFVLVTTLEAVPASEAGNMTAALAERGFHLGLLVCNRVLPRSLRDPAAVEASEALAGEDVPFATELAKSLESKRRDVTGEVVSAVLSEVGASFSNFRQVATRESELLRELSASHQVTATVPYQPGHVTDIAALLRFGAEIRGVSPRQAARRR